MNNDPSYFNNQDDSYISVEKYEFGGEFEIVDLCMCILLNILLIILLSYMAWLQQKVCLAYKRMFCPLSLWSMLIFSFHLAYMDILWRWAMPMQKSPCAVKDV